MVKNISNTSKAGLLMEILALVIMAVLVLLDKPIPDFVMWLFWGGLIMCVLPAFIRHRSNRKLK